MWAARSHEARVWPFIFVKNHDTPLSEHEEEYRQLAALNYLFSNTSRIRLHQFFKYVWQQIKPVECLSLVIKDHYREFRILRYVCLPGSSSYFFLFSTQFSSPCSTY